MRRRGLLDMGLPSAGLLGAVIGPRPMPVQQGRAPSVIGAPAMRGGPSLGEGLASLGQSLSGIADMRMRQDALELQKQRLAQEAQQAAMQQQQANSQQQARSTLYGGVDPTTGIAWNTGRQGMDPAQERALMARAYPKAAESAAVAALTPPDPNKAPTVQTFYDPDGKEYKAQWANGSWQRVGGSKREKPQVFGSAESGYYTIDNGQAKPLIPAQSREQFQGRVARLPDGTEAPIMRFQGADRAMINGGMVPLSQLPQGTTFGTPQAPSEGTRVKAEETIEAANSLDRLIERVDETLAVAPDTALGVTGTMRRVTQQTGEAISDIVSYFGGAPLGAAVREGVYSVINPSNQRDPQPEQLQVLEEDLLSAMIAARRAQGKRITETDKRELRDLVKLQGFTSSQAVRERVGEILGNLREEAGAARDYANRLTGPRGTQQQAPAPQAPAQTAPQQAAPSGAPAAGQIEAGSDGQRYRFKGGDPANPQNWEAVP